MAFGGGYRITDTPVHNVVSSLEDSGRGRSPGLNRLRARVGETLDAAARRLSLKGKPEAATSGKSEGVVRRPRVRDVFMFPVIGLVDHFLEMVSSLF